MSHWRVYGIEHIDEIREEPKEQRDAVSEARGPYNTVASRIRNLLLIIMLSILTRRSYLASLSLSLSLLFSSLFVPFVFPRSRRVLPFSLAVCCSSSVPRGKLGRCPVRESRQVSIYDGTQSLDSRRYMPSSCLGHSVCPLETLAFVRIAHSMYLVLSAIGRTVYATLIKFAFRNMKWSSVGERVG